MDTHSKSRNRSWPMSLGAIVRHYLLHHHLLQDRELAWFRTQISLEDALRVTGKAQDGEDKRYSHQRRIKPKAIAEASKRLLELHDDLQHGSSFHELWTLIRDNLGPIRGIGELYVYDTSLRIGVYLGRMPARVYLHAGTRVGAKRFGLLSRRGARKEWLESNELPVLLRNSPPSDVENLLCIYKDRLPRLKGCA